MIAINHDMPAIEQLEIKWDPKPQDRKSEPKPLIEDPDIDFLVRNITRLPRAFWDGCKLDD